MPTETIMLTWDVAVTVMQTRHIYDTTLVFSKTYRHFMQPNEPQKSAVKLIVLVHKKSLLKNSLRLCGGL